MNVVMMVWDIVWAWIRSWFVQNDDDSGLSEWWPDDIAPYALTAVDVMDESVDIEHDVAWPINRFAVN